MIGRGGRGCQAALLTLGCYAMAFGCASTSALEGAATEVHVTVVRDDAAGALTFASDGRQVLAYQYGPRWATPHVWPLLSPSGRSLLVQETEPFPHHRSLWIVDRVRIGGGPDTDFYHSWKNLRDIDAPELGHRAFIRHDGFSDVRSGDGRASATARLTWIVQDDTPVLDQTLQLEVLDLGAGEYALDLSWELAASYGDAEFRSDWVHYAWPYLRMASAFCGEQGGVITDDQGRTGQDATNGKYARWVDYSNTVDDITEGVAVLLPDDGQPRKWLTREYGTFGPRRPDDMSGTGFTLARGETLAGRVRILVHSGDVEAGRVAERHAAYVAAGPASVTAGG